MSLLTAASQSLQWQAVSSTGCKLESTLLIFSPSPRLLSFAERLRQVIGSQQVVTEALSDLQSSFSFSFSAFSLISARISFSESFFFLVNYSTGIQKRSFVRSFSFLLCAWIELEVSCFFQFLASEALPLHENIHHCRFRWIEQLFDLSIAIQLKEKICYPTEDWKERTSTTACLLTRAMPKSKKKSKQRQREEEEESKEMEQQAQKRRKTSESSSSSSAAAVVPFAASSSSSSYFCHISSSYRSAQVRQLAEDLQFYCFSDLDPLLPFCLTEMIAELVIEAAHNGNSEMIWACVVQSLRCFFLFFLSPFVFVLCLFLFSFSYSCAWWPAMHMLVRTLSKSLKIHRLLGNFFVLPACFLPILMFSYSSLYYPWFSTFYVRILWSSRMEPWYFCSCTGSISSSTAGATSTASDLSLAWRQLPLHSFPGSDYGYLTAVAVLNSSTLLLTGQVSFPAGREAWHSTSSITYSYSISEQSYQSLPSMILARSEHAMLGIADGLVLAVGGSDASGILSSCECFDLRQGKWLSVAPLLHARELCFSCSPSRSHCHDYWAEVQVLVSLSLQLNSLIHQCQVVHGEREWACQKLDTGHASVCLEEKVFVIGGNIRDPDFRRYRATATCLSFDLRSQQWTILPESYNLQVPRS